MASMLAPAPRRPIGCLVGAAAIALAGACGASTSAPGAPGAARCELPEPVVVARDGAAVLERFDLADGPGWYADVLPAAPAYAAYRRAIVAAGADRPDPAQIETSTDEVVWAPERVNRALALGGSAGVVRPARCLDAALFARQHTRHDQLTHPTEFIAVALRRGDTLRVYFGGSDTLFPPPSVYGLDQAARDRADGWAQVFLLHNHTLQHTPDGQLVLGVPAPSTNDVHLFRGVDGFAAAWVTNGLYTVEIAAHHLPRYRGAGGPAPASSPVP